MNRISITYPHPLAQLLVLGALPGVPLAPQHRRVAAQQHLRPAHDCDGRHGRQEALQEGHITGQLAGYSMYGGVGERKKERGRER